MNRRFGGDTMSSLITIDWDYFMDYMNTWNGSYIENETNIYKHWYKKYFEEKNRGIDITKHMKVGSEIDEFWDKLKKKTWYNDAMKKTGEWYCHLEGSNGGGFYGDDEDEFE